MCFQWLQLFEHPLFQKKLLHIIIVLQAFEPHIIIPMSKHVNIVELERGSPNVY